MDTSFLSEWLATPAGDKAVLCSLVAWKGSVPRKDYPAMLVRESSTPIGTIGGGDVEHRVIGIATGLLRTNVSELVDFNLENDDPDAEGGICGGKVSVVLEPFSAELQAFFGDVMAILERGKDAVVVTRVLRADPVEIRRFLLVPGEQPEGLTEEELRLLRQVEMKGVSYAVSHEKYVLNVDILHHRPVLHLFGAGHVSQAVADLAKFLDLEISVYDDREGLASADRFPHAKRRVVLPPEEAVENAIIAPGDFVLVATRGHRHDMKIIRVLLNLKMSYLGLVSSRRKWRLFREALAKEGFTAEQIGRIHAPVGLNIGAETVPEIAVSILAEIIHHQRRGGRSVASLSYGENDGNGSN